MIMLFIRESEDDMYFDVQDAQEFQCQVLNRDLWSNQGVKSIVREHFVFWQVSSALSGK